jgi:hypothetical protein
MVFAFMAKAYLPSGAAALVHEPRSRALPDRGSDGM